MNLFSRLSCVLAFLACAFSSNTAAQTYQYHVYLDADLRESTGCTVTGGGQSFAGADYRLTTVVSGSPPRATGRSLSACSGGVFPAVAPTAVNYPVGLNNGVPVTGGQADVIESMVPRSALPGVQPQVRVAFAAQSESGSIDVMFTSNGLVGGTPMILGSPMAIPTIGFFAALILAFALSFFALRTLKKNRGLAQMMLVCAFFSLGFAAWAANHIVDGLVSDWAGASPLGTDPLNDSVPPLTATDIVASFGADEAPNLFFRLDVVDAENRPPAAVNDAYTTLEDQPLNIAAPGVLANDSDPDGNPITAQLVAGPTRGTLVLNPNGGFLYTPNANINGTDSFTYNAHDGQVASSAPATVTITITPVNDVPVFTVGPNQTVLEDAGAQTVDPWATGISDGDPEVTQNLNFNITNNTNAALFSAGGAPSVSPTGVLTYSPAANANGTATITLNLSDDGGTANGGVNTSATQTFTITVTAVNDAPTFTAGPNQTVNEDAGAQTVPGWATAMDDGDPELTQTLNFTATVTGTTSNLAFSAAPAIDAVTGNLTYTATANTNGVATIEVRLVDNGSGVAPNVNTSAPQIFTITVAGVNDAPSFLVGPNQTVVEDAGAQTVDPWATALDDGDPEVTQGLSFTITNNDNAALFAAGGAPAVSPTGVLTYTPAANANGMATITLRINDDGSNTPPNVNQSATQTFTINVTAINDAPTFTAGPNQAINEDAGAQSVNPWATAMNDGDPELTQTLNFTATVTGTTGNLAFTVAPAIDATTGALTYTPTANTNGVATIEVRLVDNGSNVAPNVNTSAPQTFTITVNAVNDAPVNTVPGAQQTGDTTPLVFSTANANAISVADIDAAAGIVQMSFGTGAPANGTLTLANPGAVLTITDNGTSLVIATGTIAQLNTALNGPSGSLTYTPVASTSAARTITIITNDQGNTGSGGALIDTDTITVNVDGPPVVTSVPVNGALIANNAPITVNFSESVNVIAGITLTCGGPNLVTGGNTGSGVTSLNLTYTAPLPAGSCTLTVPAASVSDVDTIDPPNNPVGNYTATFTVDAAPAVTTTTPIDGATTANNVALSINFSEPVDATGAAVTLNCGGPITLGAITGTGVTSLNPTYTAPLPSGPCTLTVVAAQINDSDLADPPANPVANTVINFTVDAAPAFVSATPAAAAVVGTGATVSFTYDEAVTDLGGAITLNCGANVPGAVSGSGSATLTFTPTNPLTAGASCTATAVALQIGDADAFDPPQNPIGNTTRSFSVDTPPSVTSTNPSEGAINVPLAGIVQFNFSENVAFVVADFTYLCNSNPVTFGVAGTGTNQATLTPTGPLPVNAPCTVTALTTITDSDPADPPNNLAAAFPLNFTSVNDNAPSVTLSTPANGTTVANNVALGITFSENVNATAGSVTLTCGAGNLITGGTTGANVGSLTPTYAGTLPSGSCTLTVLAANVTDFDGIDPPDNMAANFVANFTVDAAPTVTTTTPINGETTANNVALNIGFSEPIDATNAVTLTCGGPNLITGGASGAGVSALVPTYAAPLPAGACVLTVLAANVTDSDAFDPPQNLAANSVINFTVDAAPAFVSSIPANGGVASTTQTISFTFTENVDNLGSGLTLTCGGAVSGVVTGSGTPTLTFTPDAPLTPGASCIASAVASQIGDTDGFDPPQNPASSALANFTVDAAPDFVSSVPAAGATNVGIASNITVTFNEAVNFTATAFTLECPAGSAIPFTVSGSGTNTATIDPTPATLPINTLCVVTVNDALVTDVDAADPPDVGTGTTTISFTTVNDNAPSVSTAQVEVVNVFTNLPLGGGAFADADTDLRITFSENVTVAGNWASLTCATSGTQSVGAGLTVTAADPVFTLNPATNLTAGESCTLTVFGAQVTDDDATDPPDAMAADAVVTFTVRDVAPRVLAPTVPLNAATVPNTQVVTFNFSEAVNLAAGSVTFNCGAAVAFAPALPVNNVSTITLTPSAPLPNGTACTVVLESTLITDVDAADPPNQLDGNGDNDIVDGDADDFTLTFNVDAQPAVTSAEVEVTNVFTALPLGGGTFADLDTDLRITFSELVNPTGNWASLTCSLSGTQSVSAGLAVIAADPVFTLNPATNLTPSESCTLTVFAAQINDDDAIDPPTGLAADAVYTFTVRDAPPQVLAPTVPLNAATVPNDQVVTFNFSEAVNMAAGSILFNCGGAVAFTPALPQNNVTTITLTPSAALPSGACTVTLESTVITDVDAIDPPNQLDGDSSNDIVEGDADDFVLAFTVDAAPTVVSTTPADLAVNVLPTSNISIDFSESVSFSTAAEVAAGDNPSFDLVCNGVPTGFSVVSTSPNDPVIINPVDSAVAGRSCVLTVRSGAAGLIADADAIDPPNFLVADFTATIGFGSDAVNDAYTVTRQLTFSAPAAVEADANDIMGLGTITGFGIAAGSANANAPGTLVDDGVNGSFRLNADGTFSFFPPANPAAASTDFFYTVSGGDSASITFTYAAAPAAELELVWFVDDNAAGTTCTGDNVGTQACPATTLTFAAAADTANDTIFVAQGSYVATITLEVGERVIGENSGSTLAAITGITPVTGSAFPAFSATAPVVTCNGSCITLATGNTLRGFTIGDSGAAGSDITGNAFGTLTVGEMTLTGNGRALNLITGTLNGAFIDINATSGSNQGIRLDAVGGTWSIANQVNIGNVGATGVNIANTPAGASLTLTGGLEVNKTATGAAVFMQTNNAAATINLGVISLTTAASAGLSVTTSSVTLTGTTGTINATGGPAIDASTATFVGGATLATVSSTNSGSTGINLNAVTGNLIMNGGAITNATGNDFDVNAGSANITYAGTITNTVARSVDITNRTGGTVTLSGAITDTGTGINLTTNTGGTIAFTGGMTVSTGTNPAFTATGGGTVTATQNNTTIVNMLTTTTGTALNVVNTTIGASGLTFRSISANGALNGILLDNTGLSGSLTVTGNAGTCTTAVNCTGGAIIGTVGTALNTAGAGIDLTSTLSPSFSRMFIQNTDRSGIRGSGVTNFTLTNSVIDDSGNGAFGQYVESNIAFNDAGAFTTPTLTGTVTITGNTLTNARRHGIQIENGSGTIANLLVQNNTLTSSTNAAVSLGTAVLVLQQGSAATASHLTTGTISNNIVTNFPSGEGIAILGGIGNNSNSTSATLGANGTPINITNNTISGQAAAASHTGSNAIRASINTLVGVMNFNISCNGATSAIPGCTATGPITNIQGQGVSVFAGGTITGTTTVDRNVIVANHTIAAGTAGIAVQVDDGPAGLNNSAADYNMVVSNNSISQYDGFGIRAIVRVSLGKMDTTIQNNQVGSTIQLANRNAIRADAGLSAPGDTTLCLNMTGNVGIQTAAPGTEPLVGSGLNAGIGLRKQGTVATVHDFGIQGIAANPTNAQVQAFVGGNNTSADGTSSVSGVDIISGSSYTSCTTN